MFSVIHASWSCTVTDVTGAVLPAMQYLVMAQSRSSPLTSNCDHIESNYSTAGERNLSRVSSCQCWVISVDSSYLSSKRVHIGVLDLEFTLHVLDDNARV